MTFPTLDNILAPHEASLFLTETLGAAALYVPGDTGKFSGLASWTMLNHLLEFGGLSFPRLRLLKGGGELPAHGYLRIGLSGYQRPLVRELSQALREGATLAVESIEELHEPISMFCWMLDGHLGVPVQADLFASWHDQPLAGLRWNDHDVIVLQTEGGRQWQLFPPTATSPSAPFQPLPPTGTPQWSGALSTGDLLYLPRGWWYSDEPCGGPSLCLAVKFRNPTGRDLLGRLAQRLGSRPWMKADVPRFGTPRSQGGFIRDFAAEVTEAAQMAGLIHGSLNEMRAVTEPRVGFCLPWSALSPPLPPSEDYMVVPLLRFPEASGLMHMEREDAFEILVGGEAFPFPERLAPLIEYILAQRGVTIRALLEQFTDSETRDTVLECVAQLVSCGAACLRPVPLDMSAAGNGDGETRRGRIRKEAISTLPRSTRQSGTKSKRPGPR
jgi:hypothetical protein